MTSCTCCGHDRDAGNTARIALPRRDTVAVQAELTECVRRARAIAVSLGASAIAPVHMALALAEASAAAGSLERVRVEPAELQRAALVFLASGECEAAQGSPREVTDGAPRLSPDLEALLARAEQLAEHRAEDQFQHALSARDRDQAQAVVTFEDIVDVFFTDAFDIPSLAFLADLYSGSGNDDQPLETAAVRDLPLQPSPSDFEPAVPHDPFQLRVFTAAPVQPSEPLERRRAKTPEPRAAAADRDMPPSDPFQLRTGSLVEPTAPADRNRQDTDRDTDHHRRHPMRHDDHIASPGSTTSVRATTAHLFGQDRVSATAAPCQAASAMQQIDRRMAGLERTLAALLREVDALRLAANSGLRAPRASIGDAANFCQNATHAPRRDLASAAKSNGSAASVSSPSSPHVGGAAARTASASSATRNRTQRSQQARAFRRSSVSPLMRAWHTNRLRLHALLAFRGGDADALRESLAGSRPSWGARNFAEAREGDPNAKRFYLSLDDEIVKAPSIGPRTADRLVPHGIHVVRDLLAADPVSLAARLNVRHITAARIEEWQIQARLVCTIPWLRGTHAQLLVGAGYTSPDDITSASIHDLNADILEFASTRDGQRVLRAGDPPDIEKLVRWSGFASMAELDRAA